MRRLLAALLAAGLLHAPAGAAQALIGARSYVVVQPGETLLDIARDRDLGYVELLLANPGVDPWLPDVGLLVQIPGQHLLPPAPRQGIVINLAELRLYYFPRRGEPLSFPIGIGREGAETPTGRTWVARKRRDPPWVPTPSERAESPELPARVPAGPDNPMGDRALYLGWPGYAIHGTNRPFSIGRRGSHGCIRMYPEDIRRLYALVAPDTPVRVIDQPYKLGWQAGQLYLEVHPPQRDADRVEQGRPPRADALPDLAPPVRLAAGGVAVDWAAVERARRAQSGVPAPVAQRAATAVADAR